jgi:hypothetical protein
VNSLRTAAAAIAAIASSLTPTPQKAPHRRITLFMSRISLMWLRRFHRGASDSPGATRRTLAGLVMKVFRSHSPELLVHPAIDPLRLGRRFGNSSAIAEPSARNPGLAELSIDLESYDDLRAQLEIALLSGTGGTE